MDNHPKDINARLRETYSNKVEADRSKSVVDLKTAHKEIEAIEKERKRPAALSVKRRLEFETKLIDIILKVIQEATELVSTQHMDEMVAIAKKESKFNMPIEQTQQFKDYIQQAQVKAVELWMPLAKQLSKNAESVRHDFQKSLEISEAEFNILFPKIKIDLVEGNTTHNDLLALLVQEGHMIMYCDRLLS